MTLCDSTIFGGEYICCLPWGHDVHHESRQYRNRYRALWAGWRDEDADDPPCRCAHTATDQFDGDIFRCDRCGDLLREVRVPDDGDTTGCARVTSYSNGQRVDYLARWELLRSGPA